MASEETIGQEISQVTKGPFVFMLMPFEFGSNWPHFKRVREVVRKSLGLACVCASDIKTGGHNLRDKVHAAIERAELVIADISAKNPNVMYEVGYAIGIRKPPLLLAEKGVDVPTDVKGLEWIPYGGDPDTDDAFPKKLREHLKFRLTSELALLREMLEAEARHPAYIVAHPKYPDLRSKIRGQVYDYRTFGDNLGVLGLISAFGSIWGEPRNVELISAKHFPPNLPESDVNLYLIGSGKVNHSVPGMLERLQKGLEPNWELGPAGGKNPKGDYWVRLFRTKNGRREEKKSKVGKRGPWKVPVFVEDHGILVRGPHPDHPNRVVLIMAGSHSLGTGAACLAATRSPLIRKIKDKLPEGTLADKRRTFWALIRGEMSEGMGLLDIEGVHIEEAGVYS